MNGKHISNLGKFYCSKFISMGIPITKGDVKTKLMGPDLLAHAHWMCTLLCVPIPEDSVSKMMRWLCFVQGVFAAQGIYSVHEMRWHNAPRKLSSEIRESIVLYKGQLMVLQKHLIDENPKVQEVQDMCVRDLLGSEEERNIQSKILELEKVLLLQG